MRQRSRTFTRADWFHLALPHLPSDLVFPLSVGSRGKARSSQDKLGEDRLLIPLLIQAAPWRLWHELAVALVGQLDDRHDVA